MKVPDIITDKVKRLPVGYVFTYEDFGFKVDKIDALTKALGRMVRKGKIRKLSPGRFYKPRISEFGELKPDTYQLVKDLLEQDDKIIGYLTGYSTYNQLGLTTQVPSIIEIGVNDLKKNISRGIYKIRFIKQPNRITKENIPLLRILDSIRNIKEIPDAHVDQSCKKLTGIISKLNLEEQTLILKLAMKYNPAARALTGAIFEEVKDSRVTEPLFRTLNPSSSYNFGISEKTLPNKLKWNIV